jgi:hypothetical protein
MKAAPYKGANHVLILTPTFNDHQNPSSKRGRPAPIVVTSTVNLNHFNRKIMTLSKAALSFGTSRTGLMLSNPTLM